MSDPSPPDLERRLERLGAALAPPRPPAPPPARAPDVKGPARGGLALALALATVAVATGHLWALAPALLLGLLSGAALLGGVGEAVLSSLPAGLAPADPARPRVGAGASVAADAVIEPGATVEMGADIGPGAVIRRGAVVRMGCTVRARAVVEAAAVVGWGCTIGEGAVVGRGAVVGAGSDVKANARVPEGMRLAPGSDWAGSAAGTPAAAAPADPRLARIDAACDRIEAELAQAPEQVRAHLGASAQAAAALRTTCHGLVERERVLRAESSPEALAFLDSEQAELEKRIAAAADEAVRGPLRAAVAAIAEQRRQRQLLSRSADRLGAELSRLQWTLDGMATQLVRLGAAGAEAAADPAALQSMHQLHDEIDAIADALEEVARADAAPASASGPLGALQPPVAEVAAPAEEGLRPPGAKDRA